MSQHRLAEKHFIHPSRAEVIGRDEYGWYAWREDAERYPQAYATFSLAPHASPRFVNLEGASEIDLTEAGFSPRTLARAS